MQPDFDVAIVGYGPTGATLANLLALAGLSVVVLERETAAYHLPRAVHFDDEVMRILQTIGVADDMAPNTHINPGMRFVDGFDVATLNIKKLMKLHPSPRSHISNRGVLCQFARKDANKTHFGHEWIDFRFKDLSHERGILERVHFDILPRFARRMSDQFTRSQGKVCDSIHEFRDADSRLGVHADNRNQRS